MLKWKINEWVRLRGQVINILSYEAKGPGFDSVPSQILLFGMDEMQKE